METARIDRWLWAVRLFKTRSAATQACRGGHVRLNGARAKPSTAVRVGDTVEARIGGRERVVQVVGIIDARVSAPAAADCLIDRSPPPPPHQSWQQLPQRDHGAGRPSKRDRRLLDRSRGRRGG